MLESIVAKLLSKYLGKYVDGLQRENLNVSLGAGDVILENLELKSDALDELDLPVTVRGGSLGKLRLKIPWKNLKSQPAVINIERLFILVGPKVQSEFSVEEYEQKLLNTKRRKLRLHEMFNSKPNNNDNQNTEEKSSDDGSYISSYTSLIINNLQIYIDKVHIRYEDSLSNPKVFLFNLMKINLPLKQLFNHKLFYSHILIYILNYYI